MNDKIPPTMPDNWPDCSMTELAYLALCGSYGQRLIAGRYLETIAREQGSGGRKQEAGGRRQEAVEHAFPKGRWTV